MVMKMMNQIEPMEKDKFQSLTFRIKSPQGSVYVQIIEREHGKIEKIIVTVGKAGSVINALCGGVAELVTHMLKGGISITDIIITLSGITADKLHTTNGMDVHSPIDAIVIALMQYRSSIPVGGGRQKMRMRKAR